ncbi:hypothetical protein J2X31_001693 [Flavobacterium arsenatis]|uniref:GOLD domain-containing protein n=1 Tax=Flavobacterium arsenatis TaxID=1484332 RepID=A0ABU1TNY1_9FLAO|nr:hypothetical protein [Flavobacterium arsenatis]MDR6967681.1 hypothetical protein [Flavobacterium arsenatis]
MKKFKLQAIALVLVVSSAFTSCSDDDSNTPPVLVTKKSLVTAVTGPETGDLNQELTLNVTFAVENNCGAFNKYVETTAGTTKTIEVESKYVGSNCGTTPTTKNTTYKFKSATAGTYNLKFKKTATEFITHTVVID